VHQPSHLWAPEGTKSHQKAPAATGIDILRFRPPGSDRWRFLCPASGPLMQVLDRALKTLPFLYLFFTTFAFLPVNPIPEVKTTKHTKYTKETGCKQIRACARSVAAVGGYQTPSFVSCTSCFLYSGVRVQLQRAGDRSKSRPPTASKGGRRQGRGEVYSGGRQRQAKVELSPLVAATPRPEILTAVCPTPSARQNSGLLARYPP